MKSKYEIKKTEYNLWTVFSSSNNRAIKDFKSYEEAEKHINKIIRESDIDLIIEGYSKEDILK